MPKSQYTDPNKLRAAGKIKFKDIPVNQYKKSIKEERKNFTDEQLLRMYHDMAVIREFETMLNSIKKEGRYNDTEFMYAGPAHLSAGKFCQFAHRRAMPQSQHCGPQSYHPLPRSILSFVLRS